MAPHDRRRTVRVFENHGQEGAMELTRRQVLKYGAGAGAALFLPWEVGTRAAVAAPLTTPTLPGSDIPKYVLPLIIPPAMPHTKVGNRDYYEIAVRQFVQQILPP